MNSFAQPLQSNAPLINRERLWQSLMDLARLGATPEGGTRRPWAWRRGGRGPSAIATGVRG